MYFQFASSFCIHFASPCDKVSMGVLSQDLVTTKPISSDEFAKLVENSQSGLTGRALELLKRH